jgi:predicted ATPase/DNA-binding CsgD family transcriptional regulator
MTVALPAPLTRFVGREAELAFVADLLAESRLVTLTGPGGAGKTRLALRLAALAGEAFPDGVWFVDLSSLSDGRFVWDQVASAVGAADPGPGGMFAEAVCRQLAGRHALIVLDNCEHMVASAAEVAAQLLTAAAGVKVLATSREPLAVDGEVTWVVPPLTEPDGVQLFTDRAHQARPELRLRDEDTQAARSICRRLDGLPLAIELAAARTRALAPARIAAHLQDHLRVLPGGPRTAPGRQATLRASFEWSYSLLPDTERALLRQLSVLAGGFDLDAALAVCPAASIELLAALTDRSLIVVDHQDGQAEPRYRMLETIREFAAERLAETGEVDLVRARHRDHYLRLAEAAEPELMGRDADRWRAQLTDELDNLRAALAWSRDQSEIDALARMVAALAWFWAIPGRITEFQMWVEAATEQAAEIPAGLMARIRNFQCLIAIVNRGSLADVPTLAGEALALARAGGDRSEEALALCNLGLVAGVAGGADAMRPYLEEGLQLARSSGFPVGTIYSIVAFNWLRMFQSDPEEPRRLIEEAVTIARAQMDRHTQLFTTAFAGYTALVHGRLTDAAELFEAAVAGGRETNDSNFMHSLLGLAWVALLRGDIPSAREEIAESRGAAQKSWNDSVSIRSVEPIATWILGSIELVSGHAGNARDILAAVVDAMRSSMVYRQAPMPLLSLAEAQLALGALDDAAATLDEAIMLAREGKLTWVLGRAAHLRAQLRAAEGEIQEAEALVHDALTQGREAGDQLGLVDALELLARLAADQGSPREAVRLWAAAESQRTDLGYARFPVDRAPHEAALADAKRALGPAENAAAWAEGAALSVDDAVTYAARGRGERRRPATGWASLTPTELEVVSLVGQHLTNPDIAARMFVSRATVKTHLIHIFGKLGVASRSELASEAIKRGIVR